MQKVSRPAPAFIEDAVRSHDLLNGDGQEIAVTLVIATGIKRLGAQETKRSAHLYVRFSFQHDATLPTTL